MTQMTDSPIKLSSRRKAQDNSDIRIRLALARINKLMAELRNTLTQERSHGNDN
jgi:hypothetical protein